MKLIIFLKIALGFTALFLGLIGILLPVWPTTPFVLLAVGCFSSTPQIQKRILKISFINEYYTNYTKKTGLCVTTVAKSLGFLWSMLAISALLTKSLTITLILLTVGLCVSTHILWVSRLGNKNNRNKKEDITGYEQ